MAKVIKATDIKWAFNKLIDTDPIQGFLHNLCIFVGEIIRSDEIGLIVFRGQPTLMVRIHKIDFETEGNYVEMINFKGSKLKEMLMDFNINNNKPTIIFSGFEVFCYRPKPEKPYHPKMYLTYNRAREKASRILYIMFILGVAPGMNTCIKFAQVDEKTSKKFYDKVSNKEQHSDEIQSLETAIDNWIAEFYTDEIGSKQYKTKNRYPLAPKPLQGCELCVITSDDDGSFIFYQTEV
ncbi:hypothetical protein ACE1B6_29400 [Aerosakkonemataceae cyanobacterium BLCC-F154]|uniref:Uncharacterized protein n=1 Tax=Floridaenema fluviatile BLCC-F154 TaxID=3153640 RepID=A0ABV4YMF2_9CYAN